VTPAVHVKGDNNPEVRGVLDVIDVRRILDYCRDLDNEQRRRIRVRQILFEKMGIALKDQSGSRTFEWRGRKWRVGVVYDNVRLANDNVFRPAEDEDLRVIIDYPFDEMGHGPREDEERVQAVLEGLSGEDARRGLPTVVWLPAFVGDDTRHAIEDLVILDGLVHLQDKDLATRVPFVSMDELPRVRSTLEQQQGYKLTQVASALESAYGVSHKFDAQLAPGLAPERQVHMLRRDAKLAVPADGMFGHALEAVLKQALEARASRHPVLGKIPTKQRLEGVLEILDKVIETPERRARLDRAQIDDLRGIAAAEHLGIVRIIEDDATFAGGILDAMAKNLANHKGPLSVRTVRAAIDPDGLMSLSREVEDFLVLAYAKAAAKPLRLLAYGTEAQALVGKLADDLSLVPVSLPGQAAWQAALKAAELLGISLGKALGPAKVDELAKRVREKAQELGTPRFAEALALLAEWQRTVGLSEPVEATLRGSTLEKLRELVGAALGAEGSSGVVEALAQVAWDPARTTALVHMAKPGKVDGVLETLRSENLKTPIAGGFALEKDSGRAAEVGPAMGRVRAALVHDENVEPLRPVLEREAAHLVRLIIVGTPKPQPQPHQVTQPFQPPQTAQPEPSAHVEQRPSLPLESPVVTSFRPRQGAAAPAVMELRGAEDVDRLAEKLRQELASGGWIRVTVEIVREGRDGGEG
jgi:hypothetical protein